MRYLRFLFFAYYGRITRRQFWLGILLAWVLSVIIGTVGFVLDFLLHTDSIETLSMLRGLHPIGLVFEYGTELVLGAGVCVKRLHDRDKRAKWLLLQVIPLVGSLWLAIELGFLPGTRGPNSWGDDPRPHRSSSQPLSAAAN